MKKRNAFPAIVLAMLLTLGSLPLPAAAVEGTDITSLYKTRDIDAAWSEQSAQAIDLNTQKGTVVIRREGDYVLSGTLNGQVVIEAGKEEKVRLILRGVTISSTQGPAIYEKQADKLIITLAEGSVSTLTDGDMIVDGDDTVGAALYAEDDLSINGTGSLIANGTNKHGIQSKADLILAGGTITVRAVSDGIRSRNSLLVLGGEMDITAGGDGISTTRTDTEGKGWIILAGGSGTITTGDGADAVPSAGKSTAGWGWRGRRDDWGSTGESEDSGVSRKAVKAGSDLTVLGGSWDFDCEDDGLHAVNVTVGGGTFSIRSGDDAMHADSVMEVSGGSIGITACYEGIEGRQVTVSGGTIGIVSSDDGINAAGGNDGSGFGGRGRSGSVSASDQAGMLSITGGEVAVTAGGDGLDSNGSLRISGGVTGVWAATTTGEGAIDFNGTGVLSGGTLIVASTGGVMRDVSGLTGQCIMAFSADGSAGETVSLMDGSGRVLGSFTPHSGFDTLMVSSGELQEGDACTVTGGERTLYSGSMASTLGSTGSGSFGGGRNRNRKGW